VKQKRSAMRIILLHNAKAGKGEGPEADDLLRAIREAGHTVTYQSTREKGAKWTLLEPADLVVAAGGDGTVRKAALGVAGRKTPVAILPLGTANNLARTFGIEPDIPGIIHNLNTASRRRMDIWIAAGPWGKIPFIESAGAGLLARAIRRLSRSPAGSAAPSVRRARSQIRELLESYPAQRWTVHADDRLYTDNLLLWEAMNIRTVGPNLRLAPRNDPGDGLLEFVFLKEAARRQFADYLDSPEGPGGQLPPVETVVAQRLHLRLQQPEALHVDDRAWPPDETDDDSRGISLEIYPASDPVEILVPA
jgi:diacylglycerol kinase (ATP)